MSYEEAVRKPTKENLENNCLIYPDRKRDLS